MNLTDFIIDIEDTEDGYEFADSDGDVFLVPTSRLAAYQFVNSFIRDVGSPEDTDEAIAELQEVFDRFDSIELPDDMNELLTELIVLSTAAINATESLINDIKDVEADEADEAGDEESAPFVADFTTIMVSPWTVTIRY